MAALVLGYVALRERRPWVRTPLDVPLAALVLWSLLASAFARHPLISLLAVAGGGCVAYLAYQVPYRWFRQDPELMDVVYRWACAALPVATAIGLASYLWVPHPELGYFRRFSLGQAPVGVYAYGLEISLLLALGAVARFPWAVGLALGVGTFALICTMSRWALLGLAAGLAIWSLTMFRRHPRAVACAFCSVAIAAVVTTSLPLTREIVQQYVPPGEALWTRAAVVGFTPQTGFPGLLAIWEATLRLIREHAWFGTGYGAFPMVYREYLAPSAYSMKVPEIPAHLFAAHPHNDVLSVAASSGLPAAGAYVVLLLVALGTALRHRNQRAAPAVAALVAVLIHGLFDAISTVSIGPLVVFFVILAAAVQPASHREESSQRV